MSSALVLLALLSPLAHAAVPSIDGFTVEWSDDFTGAAGSLPDSANWIFTTGTSYPGGAPQFGTWEIETYTANPENVQTDGQGNLQITAIKTGESWTSSRIETQRTDFMAPAGGKMRIQASLSLPKVAQPIGYWPAFWTLGAKFRGVFTNWPGVGEFDIMENVNGLNRVAGTLHCGTAPGGPCDENNGIGSNTTGPEDRPLQGNFHTYTFEVDRTSATAGKLTWFFNDQQYHQVLQSQVEAAAWDNAVNVPHFLLLNLAIGGSFPDKVLGSKTPVADTTSGGIYRADYVAVYYSEGGAGGPGGPGGQPPSSSSTSSLPTPNPTSSLPTPNVTPPTARRHVTRPFVRRRL